MAPTVFSIASKLFAGADEAEYAQLVAPETWGEFLDELRASVPERSLGDLVGQSGLEALENPPSFAEYSGFCRRHFTGGLAASAMPVESIYRTRRTSSDGELGSYRADSAQYMEDLIARMGFTLPPEYAAWPDHLALELDLLAVLQRSGYRDEARLFVSERFDWLPDFRQQLLQLGDEQVDFFIALLDVLIDVLTTHQ